MTCMHVEFILNKAMPGALDDGELCCHIISLVYKGNWSFLYSDCVYIVFILVSIYFIPLLSHEIPIYTIIKIQNSTPPDLT